MSRTSTTGGWLSTVDGVQATAPPVLSPLDRALAMRDVWWVMTIAVRFSNSNTIEKFLQSINCNKSRTRSSTRESWLWRSSNSLILFCIYGNSPSLSPIVIVVLPSSAITVQ